MARSSSAPPSRGLLAGLGGAGACVGIGAEWVSVAGAFGYSAIDVVRDIAVGWAFLAAGLVAWSLRPASRVGPLMVVVGFTWFIGNAGSIVGLPGGATGVPLAAAIVATSLGGLQRAFQTHLIVAYPSGRIRDHVEQGFVVAAYGLILFNAAVRLVALGPATVEPCPPPCPDNPFLLVHDPALGRILLGAGVAGELAVTLGLLAILVRRWRSASKSLRARLAPFWLGATVTVLVFVAAEVALALGAPAEAAASAIQAAQIAVPFAFLAGLLRLRLARTAVGDLVLELSRTTSHAGIRAALSRALGDPTLTIAFPIGPHGAYTDDSGRPVEAPAADATKAVTRLRSGDAVVAVLVHDPALDEDPGLVQQAGAAAMFAIENVRLQLELRAQLAEVRASRARIVEAGDAERRRVERDLHDGAQQRLATLAIALRMARDRAGAAADTGLERLLDEAADELGSAVRELRELARGIHPAILTDEGLRPAIEALAVRAPLPVQVDVPPNRLPAVIEATAYFVVCEALTNVVKHGRAGTAVIHGDIVDGVLRIEVADDGAGGADAARGSGLRGLADRVAASGGSLSIESPVGAGTRIIAEIPCA